MVVGVVEGSWMSRGGGRQDGRYPESRGMDNGDEDYGNQYYGEGRVWEGG